MPTVGRKAKGSSNNVVRHHLVWVTYEDKKKKVKAAYLTDNASETGGWSILVMLGKLEEKAKKGKTES